MKTNIYSLVKGDNNLPTLKVERSVNIEGSNHDLEDLCDFVREIFGMGESLVEKVVVVCFNTERRIIGMSLISIGDIDTASVYKRTIGIIVLLTGAYSFSVFHNHPDNQNKASDDDKSLDFEMNCLATFLGVNYENSIIITEDDYTVI
jgi:DNA repair protein RadC